MRIVEQSDIGSLSDLITKKPSDFRNWTESAEKFSINPNTDLTMVSNLIQAYLKNRTRKSNQHETANLSTVVLLFENPETKKTTYLILLPSWPDTITIDSEECK